MAAGALTITDAGDGTVSGTIIGADPSTGYVLYSQTVDGELGSSTWTIRAADTTDASGDATIAAFAMANGMYWWHVAVGTVATNLVYQNVQDGTDAVFEQCLAAVLATVQGLSLSGIPNASVMRRKLPWAKAGEPPAVLISPVPERINQAAGTNAKDDIGYGIMVSLYRTSNRDLTGSVDTTLLWREKVRRAFHNKRLAGVTGGYRSTIEPGEPFIPAAFLAHYDAQFLVVRTMVREVRT